MTDAVRTLVERQAAARQKLESDIDVWFTTTSGNRPHLVPLSLYWDGDRVVVATPRAAVTVTNALTHEHVKLMLGDSRDVVLIDAIARMLDCDDAPEHMKNNYAQRTGWNPCDDTSTDWVYLVCDLRRVQVWRDLPEMDGRLVMTDGQWL